MTIYSGFIRGINVGGKNKVKMADLKHLLESMGLVHVETYIQSGNVLFESNEDEEALREKLESGFAQNFGISASVILRTAGELEGLILDCPFSAEEIKKAESLNSEGESLYVNLFTHAPSREKIESLHELQSEDDQCRMLNRDAYLLLRHSIRHSKLAGRLQKLDVPGTTRNWKTINKLLTLAKSRIK